MMLRLQNPPTHCIFPKPLISRISPCPSQHNPLLSIARNLSMVFPCDIPFQCSDTSGSLLLYLPMLSCAIDLDMISLIAISELEMGTQCGMISAQIHTNTLPWTTRVRPELTSENSKLWVWTSTVPEKKVKAKKSNWRTPHITRHSSKEDGH